MKYYLWQCQGNFGKYDNYFNGYPNYKSEWSKHTKYNNLKEMLYTLSYNNYIDDYNYKTNFILDHMVQTPIINTKGYIKHLYLITDENYLIIDINKKYRQKIINIEYDFQKKKRINTHYRNKAAIQCSCPKYKHILIEARPKHRDSIMYKAGWDCCWNHTGKSWKDQSKNKHQYRIKEM